MPGVMGPSPTPCRGPRCLLDQECGDKDEGRGPCSLGETSWRVYVRNKELCSWKEGHPQPPSWPPGLAAPALSSSSQAGAFQELSSLRASGSSQCLW